MSSQSTIYHLEYKGRHYYYGSIASIYEDFSREELGVSIHTLWEYKITEDRPYLGKECLIRKGLVRRKKQQKNKC